MDKKFKFTGRKSITVATLKITADAACLNHVYMLKVAIHHVLRLNHNSSTPAQKSTMLQQRQTQLKIDGCKAGRIARALGGIGVEHWKQLHRAPGRVATAAVPAASSAVINRSYTAF